MLCLGWSEPEWCVEDAPYALVTDGSMNWMLTMRYNPWGSVRYMSGSAAAENAYTYTGQRQDSYINLLFFGSGWYDPLLGHFISLIPLYQIREIRKGSIVLLL